MSLGIPDPLDAEGDELYSLYRKGIITRHIARNGRYLEAIALESADELLDNQSGNYITLTHSTPNGRIGPNTAIRVPTVNCRHTLEIDPTAPTINGHYAVRPHLWVPLIAPLKYPGLDSGQTGVAQGGASPWFPQSYQRKRYVQKDMFFAASGSGDNPGYYGGMALAAFSLEHIYGVSSYSITYARKLIEGFLAMEMNGKNGYIIRYDRWFIKPYEPKEIRGASAEELLGIMLGIMFYLKAETQNHPLYNQAMNLRDRILARVSQGNIWSYYEHPFMTQAYWVKHFEVAFYASKGQERGSRWWYNETRSKSIRFSPDKFLENLAMYLTSIILVLEGNLPEETKENYWAGRFMYYIKWARRAKPGKVHKNAYLGAVALLVNKYLNSQRDSQFLSQRFLNIWTRPEPSGGEGLELQAWNEIIGAAEDRIASCKSLGNSLINFSEENHWQHNLPFLTIWEDPQIYTEWGGVWKNLNPHRRSGKHFEWKSKYPNDWLRTSWRFGDYAIGMSVDEHLDEKEYNDSLVKRYASQGYLDKEVLAYRGHNNVQIEGTGIGLFFLRMLLTYINSDVYPPPVLAADEEFPILPFQGVEPLSPKFLHYSHRYRSVNDGWKIKGDKDKSLRVICVPEKQLFITASAGDGDSLWLDSWKTGPGRFVPSASRQGSRFDQIVMRKTSSSFNAANHDILITAERAEIGRTFRDDHFLRISMYRIFDDGYLEKLTDTVASGVAPGAAQEIDICILNFRYLGVTFKTRHDKARLKLYELDFNNRLISERIAMDAESGTNQGHDDIGNAVWVGSAWSDVVVNGYETKTQPNRHFSLFSRKWLGHAFGQTFQATGSACEGKPLGAVILKRNKKFFLVAASFVRISRSGFEGCRFIIQSWEIAESGQLIYRGQFPEDQSISQTDYILKPAWDFERLEISRAYLGGEECFVIAGKAFTDARRPVLRSNKGLVIILGEVLADGRPTIRDWNCVGGGDEVIRKSAEMVDVCGDGKWTDQDGVVTVYKDKAGGMSMVWWRYGKDFKLEQRFRIDPPGLGGNLPGI